MVKNMPAMQEIWVWLLAWEDPWRRERYPLQYSGLENSIDCTVHGVAKNQTWLSEFRLLSFSFWSLHPPLSFLVLYLGIQPAGIQSPHLPNKLSPHSNCYWQCWILPHYAPGVQSWLRDSPKLLLSDVLPTLLCFRKWLTTKQINRNNQVENLFAYDLLD